MVLYENERFKIIKAIDEFVNAGCEYQFYVGGTVCTKKFKYAIVDKSEDDFHAGHVCKEHVERVWILTNNSFPSFYDAWAWLNSHPINNIYTSSYEEISMGLYDLDIMVVKTDKYGTIKNNTKKNTRTRVWLEFGRFELITRDVEIPDNWARTHDPRLDCGGDTFEEAITVLAARVKHYYGDYVNE